MGKARFITNEICEGCLTSIVPEDEDHIYPCNNMAYNIDGSCPCTICIVKMVCCEECDDYVIWTYKKRDTFVSVGRR